MAEITVGPPADVLPRGRSLCRLVGESGDDQHLASVARKDGLHTTVREEPTRKRKRSRKGLDKNFTCPEPGCGKSYSRAEHLSRHQLNHAPRKIYRCEHFGCESTFVRQDLCARHQERHSARGSHLQRKSIKQEDSARQHNTDRTGQVLRNRNNISEGSMSKAFDLPNFASKEVDPAVESIRPIRSPENSFLPSPGSVTANFSSLHTHDSPLSKSSHTSERAYAAQTISSFSIPRSHACLNTDHLSGNQSTGGIHSTMDYVQIGPHESDFRRAEVPYAIPYKQSASRPGTSLDNTNIMRGNQHHPNYKGHVFAMDLSDQANMGNEHAESVKLHSGADFDSYSNNENFLSPDNLASSGKTLCGREHEIYGNAPQQTADEFVNFLFNESVFPQSSSPGGPRQGTMSFGTTAFMEDDGITSRNDIVAGDAATLETLMQSHPMALHSILDPDSLHAKCSEVKRQELIKLIGNHFQDNELIVSIKSQILTENADPDTHILSRQRIQLYLRSYWNHFHPQMPILHKPTFSVDTSETLLLVALISIGAACLEPAHGTRVVDAATELANFLAFNLRIEIFRHRASLPPAPLWVFQSLLLLEFYEKMYSTRLLHERAYIFHGPTIDLMRRGPALTGRIGVDSVGPSSYAARTDHEVAYSVQSPLENNWRRWVNNEATRRVALAAFAMDSIHAIMFGHRAHMAAHEMKLGLPCAETLWAAKSGQDVAKKEAELMDLGRRPMSFYDGLKNTLKGKDVQVGPLGRMAIMAGLLNVTFMMNQRDISIHNLGVAKALGGREMWRKPVTEAFDAWKSSFDATIRRDCQQSITGCMDMDDENMSESRTVLHHLSHMAMHVDIVTCQIFAGAEHLLGRATLSADFEVAQKRIRGIWAPKPSARHATFYALKFLAHVLIPHSEDPYSRRVPSKMYSARDDNLLNRPWVLYYAALVVWCYGFAIDGKVSAVPDLSTPVAQHADMVRFLTTIGGISAPGELIMIRGRNNCLGLLHILRSKFRECRWQLLHEAAKLLGKCIDQLEGNPP